MATHNQFLIHNDLPKPLTLFIEPEGASFPLDRGEEVRVTDVFLSAPVTIKLTASDEGEPILSFGAGNQGGFDDIGRGRRLCSLHIALWNQLLHDLKTRLRLITIRQHASNRNRPTHDNAARPNDPPSPPSDHVESLL